MADNTANFESYNLFRRPDWRYDRVIRMVQREPRPGRCTRHDDEWVRGFRNFIVRFQNAEAQNNDAAVYDMKHAEPGLYFAYMLYRESFNDAVTTFMLKARILARKTDIEIASDMATMPDTINWYEKLFFNIRDRIGSQDWIVKYVLYPSIAEAEAVNAGQTAQEGEYNRSNRYITQPLWDPRILWFAYFFGPASVDFWLTGFRRDAMPNSQEELGDSLEAFVREGLGRQVGMASHAMEVNKYNIGELLSIYGQFVSIAKSDVNEEQKQTMLQKSVDALLTDMPWAIGNKGVESVKGSAVEAYDDSPVELRTDQLLKLSSGEGIPEYEIAEIQNRMQGLPPAPERKVTAGQEDLFNAND